MKTIPWIMTLLGLFLIVVGTIAGNLSLDTDEFIPSSGLFIYAAIGGPWFCFWATVAILGCDEKGRWRDE